MDKWPANAKPGFWKRLFNRVTKHVKSVDFFNNKLSE